MFYLERPSLNRKDEIIEYLDLLETHKLHLSEVMLDFDINNLGHIKL